VSGPPEWMNDAACIGYDLSVFFPKSGRGTASPARMICADCTVRDDCLEYALSHEHGTHDAHGIYAGLTGNERHGAR
jgi:WhiB family redox-sensing transcriptional regulator